MHVGSLDSTQFPYIGDQPVIKKSKKGQDSALKGAQVIKGGGRMEQVFSDIQNNPRLFVFVAGGLSHHEVVNIANLQKELPAQIIPGSNEIFSVQEYLDQLESLHRKENIMQFKDQVMKEASWGEKGPDLDDTDLNLNDNYDADLDYTINF